MTWATKDIGLAAFLSATGSRPTLSVDLGRSVWFVWDAPRRLQKAAYYQGAPIPALPYYQELRRLRSAVYDALTEAVEEEEEPSPSAP